LNIEHIINEPTVAAIAYKMGNQKGSDELHTLVFDLGGGTFDVTLLAIDGGVFEVMVTNGNTHLGGEDFDQQVMQYFFKIVQKKNGVNILDNPLTLQKLCKEVDCVKRSLSSQQQAHVKVESLIDVAYVCQQHAFQCFSTNAMTHSCTCTSCMTETFSTNQVNQSVVSIQVFA
jgi:heat shock protein 5